MSFQALLHAQITWGAVLTWGCPARPPPVRYVRLECDLGPGTRDPVPKRERHEYVPFRNLGTSG